MTIRNRELNEQLSNLERCTEYAPEGTYKEAREAADAIADISNFILERFREAGFKVNNCDPLRDIEATLYGYLKSCNPEAYGLITGEGFGEHVTGRTGERIIAQAEANRDFFRARGLIQ